MRPAFKELAQLKGWKFKEVNVENCETKICSDIDYVPTVFVGRKKLDLKEMQKLLNE